MLLSTENNIGITSVFARSIVAVDLKSGNILWRQQTEERPVAVAGGYVVGMVVGPQLHFVVRAIESGEVRSKVQDLGLPDCVEVPQDRPDALAVDAMVDGDRLNIYWQVPPRYLGGAAPRAGSQNRSAVAGRIIVDLSNGFQQSERIDATTESSGANLDASENPDLPHRLAGELERAGIGDHAYVLRVENSTGGGLVAKLSGLKTSTSALEWETEIGRSEPEMRMTPLRK